MKIVCPSCATSYEVEPASLSPKGRQVRCLRCRTIWHAELSQADKLLVAAAAIAPDHGAGGATVAVAEVAMSRSAAAASAEMEDHAAGFDQSAGAPTAGALAVEPGDYEAASASGADGASFDAANESADAESLPIAPVALDERRPHIDSVVAAEHGHEPA
jgi:predicted Zn finger-like uncharacterized protein